MSRDANGQIRHFELARAAVRDILSESTDYRRLDPATRKELARGLVRICSAALDLADESARAEKAAPPPPVIARAQSAGSEFSGVAAQRVADTTRQILNAVSFPRFVTELINGVFKAMVDSNQQQMQSYVELIRNVAASTEGFADANVGLNGARSWLAERFPGSFTVEGETDPFAEPGQKPDPEEQAEMDAETRLRLRPGASMPNEGSLRLALGLGPQDSVPTGDPESLVPLARTALARNRQQMLSTMVMLGMQRIVIESGRLHASMRFHIDTHSAAADDRGSQFDFRNTTSASGSFGYGPWGASASMTNTIGYVSTQRTQTSEEMNTDLDLNSSVELVFKTDYLPLDRLAGREQVDRIKVNTINPEAEAKQAADSRQAREKRIAESETKRRESLDKSFSPPPAAPAAPKAGEPGSPEAADKARKEAAKTGKGTDKTKTAAKPKETSKPKETGKPAGKETPKASAKTSGKSGTTKSTASGLSYELSSSPDETESDSGRKPDVVFIPTLPEAIDEMLSLANISRNDVLYELGCGDGRVVARAAWKYGCRAVGVDIDPLRVAESRQTVANNHLEHLVGIVQQDMFTVDLSRADIVIIYLLPELNVRLIPQFERMKPGARIVSQDFDMAGIIPDRVVQVYLDRHGVYKTFYLWTTPLKKKLRPVYHEWSNATGLTSA